MNNELFELPMDYIPNGDGTAKPVYADRKGVRVQFETIYTVNEQRSKETGKLEHDKKVVILKQARGDTNVPANLATEYDKIEHKEAWEKFQAGESGELGFGLSKLEFLPAVAIASFNHLGILTVDQLADAAEVLIDQVERGKEYQVLAKLWLDERTGRNESASLIVQAEGYRTRNIELEEENKKLREELASKGTKNVKKISRKS